MNKDLMNNATAGADNGFRRGFKAGAAMAYEKARAEMEDKLASMTEEDVFSELTSAFRRDLVIEVYSIWGEMKDNIERLLCTMNTESVPAGTLTAVNELYMEVVRKYAAANQQYAEYMVFPKGEVFAEYMNEFNKQIKGCDNYESGRYG